MSIIITMYNKSITQKNIKLHDSSIEDLNQKKILELNEKLIYYTSEEEKIKNKMCEEQIKSLEENRDYYINIENNIENIKKILKKINKKIENLLLISIFEKIKKNYIVFDNIVNFGWIYEENITSVIKKIKDNLFSLQNENNNNELYQLKKNKNFKNDKIVYPLKKTSLEDIFSN